MERVWRGCGEGVFQASLRDGHWLSVRDARLLAVFVSPAPMFSGFCPEPSKEHRMYLGQKAKHKHGTPFQEISVENP